MDLDQNIQDRLEWYKQRFNFSIENGVVIDVGGGAGRYSTAFARYAQEVHVIDSSSKPESLPSNVAWHKGVLPYEHNCPPSRGDFLFCANVLEHIEPSTVGEFLRDCCQLLKPGGYAFFSWAPVWSKIGAHMGPSPKNDWQHVIRKGREWFKWLETVHGKEYHDKWCNLEWRPGLSRHKWFILNEPHLTLRQLENAIMVSPLLVEHHNTAYNWEEDCLIFCLRTKVLRRFPSISFSDLTCASDTWMLRREEIRGK